MAVSYDLRDGVAFVQMDDGKVNAISHELIRSVHGALDRAERETGALLLAGRPGRFSGGFDLNEMRKGPAEAAALVGAGAELALRLYGFPRPVVIACTGHALAMGAILLFTADTRLGADGDFKIGMNEVAIAFTLPDFAVELAKERLSTRHLTRAALEAEIYTPNRAVDAGYLDSVTRPEALLAEALAEAKRLAPLDAIAFRDTKARLRAATIERIRSRLREDMRRIVRVPR